MKIVRVVVSILLVLMTTSCSSEPASLRLGTMPTYSAAIYMVGIEKGFFEEAGVQVELTLFRSARDRDGAAAAGELDGFMTDIMGAVNMNVKGFPFVMTSGEYDDFGIMTGSSVSASEATVGLAENTVTEFIADMYMDGNYEKVNILSVPDRMGALLGGSLAYGVFPQPFMGIIEAKGGQAVRTTASEGIFPVVLVFDRAYMSHEEEAVTAFYEGYQQTVTYMQNNAFELYKDILVDGGLATEDTVDLYELPLEDFGINEVDRDTYGLIMSWMLSNDLLTSPVAFEDVVMSRWVK